MSVTRWEKGRSKRGVNPTHMISWHTPLTPLSEVAKAITGEQGIKKVIKQLLRAGCGTRPSREGRAEGGVGYKGPLIFIRAATRLPGALFDRRPQPGARLWLQLRDPPPNSTQAVTARDVPDCRHRRIEAMMSSAVGPAAPEEAPETGAASVAPAAPPGSTGGAAAVAPAAPPVAPVNSAQVNQVLLNARSGGRFEAVYP